MDPISAYKKLSFNYRFKSERVARLISDLINPLFVPPVVIGILIWLLGGSSNAISRITSLAVLFYTLIPLTGAFYLLQTDQIISLDLPDRKSRRKLYPFIIASAATAFLCFFLTVYPMYKLIAVISLVFLINILFGYGINRIWKISVHAAAVSSAGAIFLNFAQFNTLSPVFGIQILSLIILLLLLPLMIWARYCLNIHTLAELFGGAASGFLLTLLQLTILINLW